MNPATSDSLAQAVCAAHGLPAIPPEDQVAVAISTLGQMPVYGTRIVLPENGTVSSVSYTHLTLPTNREV